MNNYKHTQIGKLIIIAMTAASLLVIFLGKTSTPITLFILPILLFAGWLFHSLTIEVTNDQLRWRFGSGIIRKQIPLSDIVSAEPVRTNLLEGWGIHWSRFGWLYNVSGWDAVAITTRNGKRFALGSDQSEELVAELKKAIQSQKENNGEEVL